MSKQLIILGATGFIGRFLCAFLLERGYHVRALVRKKSDFLTQLGVEQMMLFQDPKALAEAMRGFDAVIHLVGRSHQLKEKGSDFLAEYRKTNVEFTRLVLQAMTMASVKKLVYLSSIHVFSNRSVPFAISEKSPCQPTNPYGISKLEAERLIAKTCDEQGMHFLILRPPLVYGPGVPANMRNLMKLVQKMPVLPFGNANNIRSMIYVGNLAGLMVHCIANDTFPNQSYYVSDQQDMSIKVLVLMLVKYLERRVILFPVPVQRLRWLGRRFSTWRLIDQLFGQLQVEATQISQDTGWKPAYTPEQGVAAMVQAYRCSLQGKNDNVSVRK